MPITYPLTFPSHLGIQNIVIRPKAAVSRNISPFTFHQQVQRFAGQMWQADVTLPKMTRDDAEPYQAFLLRLNGREGTFLLGDPAGATPRGLASQGVGTPLVNGGGQTGNTLNLDGLPASKTGFLLAGDYLQIGTGASARLYKVTADCNTTAGGLTSVDIWPRLRSSPADNTPVILTNCVGLFRLASNEMPFAIDAPYIYNIKFSCEEAL